MGHVLKTLGKIALGVGLIVVSGGFGSLLGLSGAGGLSLFGSTLAGSLAATAGLGLIVNTTARALGLVKKPQTLQTSYERLNATADPNALGKLIIGPTALGTDMVYTEQYGSKNQNVLRIFVGAAHTIHSIGALHFDDQLVYNAAGTLQSAFSGTVVRQANVGTESQAALSFSGATWGSTDRWYGHPIYGLQYDLSSDKLKNGITPRVTQECQGLLMYDPRLDTTVGGSGSQRADDQTTWTYQESLTGKGVNPALVAITYLLGWKINSAHAFGMFVDISDIDYDAFIAAANVCEETVDSKPRYAIAGIWQLDGQHESFFEAIKASAGIEIRKTAAGLYTCWAPNNDLTAVDSISDGDIVTEVTYDPGSLEGRYNTGKGNFVDPDVLYQPRPYPEIVESSYVTLDGRSRILNRDMSLQQDADVAQRVVRYAVRRSRWQQKWAFGVDYRYLARQIFDVITLNCDETGNVDRTVRIVDKEVGADCIIRLTVQAEDSSIYDDTTPPLSMPAAASIAGYDPSAKVAVSGLAAADQAVSGDSGTAKNYLLISWTDPGATVAYTEVQYRVVAGPGATQSVPSAAIDLTQALAGPVEQTTDYEVRARHITITGVIGDWSSWVGETSGSSEVVGTASGAPWSGITNDDGNIPANRATSNLRSWVLGSALAGQTANTITRSSATASWNNGGAYDPVPQKGGGAIFAKVPAGASVNLMIGFATGPGVYYNGSNAYQMFDQANCAAFYAWAGAAYARYSSVNHTLSHSISNGDVIGVIDDGLTFHFMLNGVEIEHA